MRVVDFAAFWIKNRSKCVPSGLFARPLEAVFRPPETLRPLRGQPVAVLIQIHQREGRTQPLMVLLQAPIAYLDKSKDALQNAERMLYLGPDSGLGLILALGLLVHIVLELGAAVGHILRLG